MFDSKLSLKNNRTLLFGIFESGDHALDTTRKVYDKGVDIIDCYTPYPIHGMEKAMGLKRSRLPIGAFICGSIGFSLALTLQSFIMYFDWPIIIGNKPYAGIPSWVPVLFEFSILCTAFGIGIMFFARNKMIHGKVPDEIVDPAQTDYRIVLAMSLDEEGVNKDELIDLLRKGGAVEIKERVNHPSDQTFTEKVLN
jgi:hypothetical protein